MRARVLLIEQMMFTRAWLKNERFA
ncbi:hypothetical protein MPLA_1930018 [Mesorhizobium sp. ORS 3359]|nr:hypothetical protein MPLA_1930018 [Mesorhizobium sp. ORS 3359]